MMDAADASAGQRLKRHRRTPADEVVRKRSRMVGSVFEPVCANVCWTARLVRSALGVQIERCTWIMLSIRPDDAVAINVVASQLRATLGAAARAQSSPLPVTVRAVPDCVLRRVCTNIK